MDFASIALVIVGVGYVLYRRTVGDLVQVKRLVVLPVVLTAIGLSQFGGAVTLPALVFVVIGTAASLAIGAVRGLTVHLGVRDGALWMRYRAVTVALWLLNIAVKLVLVPIEVALTDQSVATATHGMLFTLGLGLLAESAVVLLRATRREGTIVWATGSDSRSRRSGSILDRP